MIFTDLEAALEEGDFLSKNYYETHYLLSDGDVYYLLNEEERTEPMYKSFQLLEVFRSCIYI